MNPDSGGGDQGATRSEFVIQVKVHSTINANFNFCLGGTVLSRGRERSKCMPAGTSLHSSQPSYCPSWALHSQQITTQSLHLVSTGWFLGCFVLGGWLQMVHRAAERKSGGESPGWMRHWLSQDGPFFHAVPEIKVSLPSGKRSAGPSEGWGRVTLAPAMGSRGLALPLPNSQAEAHRPGPPGSARGGERSAVIHHTQRVPQISQ